MYKYIYFLNLLNFNVGKEHYTQFSQTHIPLAIYILPLSLNPVVILV